MASLSVESRCLYVPSLEELGQVLREGLDQNFAHVDVSVVSCPDLSQPPYHLAASGLGGDAAMVDLGGVPYLIPTAQRDRNYNLADLPAMMKLKPGANDGTESSVFILGAGAGPWQHLSTNCEMMANLSLKLKDDCTPTNTTVTTIVNGSRLATVNSTGQRKLHESLSPEQTGCSLLANLLVTHGMPSTPVIKVNCSVRTGPETFVSCMRRAIREHYTPLDQVVGMGGVFLLDRGRAKLHIMPDFSPCPLETDADVDRWLHFYEANAPLVNLSVFISSDPGLDLRIEHTHCFSTHGEGGHYHGDTTPDIVQYQGFFIPAKKIFRIDRPHHTHNVGRD